MDGAMGSFEGKTVFITGSSRGLGKAIGLRFAAEGANVVVVAKTVEPHPRLPGTIYTAAEEMNAAGGKGLAIQTDLRSEEQINAAVDKAVETFGGIDILVNNASALHLINTLGTTAKRYDLMTQVNVRGTFFAGKACIPHLAKAENPHILNISPPLNLDPRWFAQSLAYTITKYGMSMCVLGWAEELKDQGIAANCLWPKTLIDTSAVQNLLGGPDMAKRGRTTDIVGDAAHAICSRPSRECTGNFFIDEDILRETGVEDFDKYAIDPSQELVPDFFL